MGYKDKDKQREFTREWVKKRRADWISSQGGKCRICGSTDNLEVDHIDPSKKTMYPRNIWSRTESVRNKELLNCQVLCHECHKTKTKNYYAEQRNHGTPPMSATCPCDPCKAYRANKMRMRRQTNRNRICGDCGDSVWPGSARCVECQKTNRRSKI